VSTAWPKVRAFLAEIQRLAGAESYVVIVEVCGFNDWLLALLPEYGCRHILLVQPDQAARQKTDRRDASALSETLWVSRQRLLAGKRVKGVRVVQLPGAVDVEARQLTELRKRLGQQRTRTINRIKHLLRKHNLEQECPTKGLDTIGARKWLRGLELAPIDRLELDQLLAQWELWKQQIPALEAEIKRRQAEHATAVVLASIPGCSAYSSLTLAARIGDIRRFPRPASLANYWGLAPRCHNSGDVKQRLGSITKQGSATARFILGQLVLHVLRRDAQMRAWYNRIKRRRGSKIARVAVMRRLTTIIWQMVTHHEAYTPGGPPRLRQGRRVA
jgi:transposase